MKFNNTIDKWINENSIYFNIIYCLVKNKLPGEDEDKIFYIVCQWIHSLYQSWKNTPDGYFEGGLESSSLKDNLNPDIILQIDKETTFKCEDKDLIQFENERLKKLNNIGLNNQDIVYQQILQITKEIYTPPLKNQEAIAAQEKAGHENVLSLFCACCKKVLAFFVKFCQIFFKKK